LSEETGEVINRCAGKIHQFASKNAATAALIGRKRKAGEAFASPALGIDDSGGSTAARGWGYFFFLAAFFGFFAAAFFAGFFFAASFLAGFLIAIDNPPFPCAVARRQKCCAFLNDQSHYAPCGVNNL
jgi:hypothetical protein